MFAVAKLSSSNTSNTSMLPNAVDSVMTVGGIQFICYSPLSFCRSILLRYKLFMHNRALILFQISRGCARVLSAITYRACFKRCKVLKFFKSIPNESGAHACQLINGTTDGVNSNGIDGIFGIWDVFRKEHRANWFRFV